MCADLDLNIRFVLRRIDWPSVHFGFPGKVCWQHPDNVMTDNYVMVFPSNPVRGVDGVAD